MKGRFLLGLSALLLSLTITALAFGQNETPKIKIDLSAPKSTAFDATLRAFIDEDLVPTVSNAEGGLIQAEIHHPSHLGFNFTTTLTANVLAGGVGSTLVLSGILVQETQPNGFASTLSGGMTLPPKRMAISPEDTPPTWQLLERIAARVRETSQAAIDPMVFELPDKEDTPSDSTVTQEDLWVSERRLPTGSSSAVNPSGPSYILFDGLLARPAVLAPQAETAPTVTTELESGEVCDPSYPSVCIPPPPPDLDCGEISHRRFRVIGSDPHRFDGDNDGIGCEGS